VNRDRVFISYRRSDSQHAARLLRLALEQRLDRPVVFQDEKGILPGE
jgi:hypothetical protein